MPTAFHIVLLEIWDTNAKFLNTNLRSRYIILVSNLKRRLGEILINYNTKKKRTKQFEQNVIL